MKNKLNGDYILFIAALVILIVIVICIVFSSQLNEAVSNLDAVSNKETILEKFMDESINGR